MKIDDLKNLAKTDILEALGLEPKRSTPNVLTSSLGIFAAGMVVGAATALLLAPKAGREIRDDVGSKLRSVATKAASLSSQVEKEISSSLG